MTASNKLNNLVDIFELSVKKFSENKWLGEKDKHSRKYDWITYGQAGIRVDNFRAGLSELGVNRQESIGIISNNSIEWAISCYATYGLGAIFVPMYESELEKVWKHIINDSAISVLLISKSEIFGKICKWLENIKTLKHVIIIDDDLKHHKKSFSDIEKTGQNSPIVL